MLYIKVLHHIEKLSSQKPPDQPEDTTLPTTVPEDWLHKYDKLSSEKAIHDLDRIGLDSCPNLLNLLSTISSTDKPSSIISACRKAISEIPEVESRDYYSSKLDALSKMPNLILTADLSDMVNRDLFSTAYSILIRMFCSFIDGPPIDLSEDEEQAFAESGGLSTIVGGLYYTFSQLAFQCTMPVLLDKITQGDDKAIFKAVTIDKSLLYNEDVKKRVTEAQLTGDTKFFKKLAKALSDNPLRNVGEHSTTFSVLHQFWYAGLYKLTYAELYDFLVECGLIPPTYPDAFKKFMKRHIVPIFEN